MKRHSGLRQWGLKVSGTGALVLAAIGAVPPEAFAQTSTALQRCQQAVLPDFNQTVFQRGIDHQVNYPNELDPDNAIYPGDVVKVTASGSIRYNPFGDTAGPSGNGQLAPGSWPFPGFKQAASIANWNNNPGGWVGGSIATSALAGCTNAPASHPVRLIYRINDPNLSDNAGFWQIRTQVWKAAGSVVIDGVQVTQGVQTTDGKIPLLAGKRTFVRVFVRSIEDGRGPMTGVRASLQVEGQSGSLAPVGNATITASPLGSNPRSLADSFLFELGAGGIKAGTRKLTVTVVPPAGRGPGHPFVRRASITFGPSSEVKLTVVGARYSYSNVPRALQVQEGLASASWQARPASAWTPMRVTAENALPLSSLTISDLAPTSASGSTTLDCKAEQRDDGSWSCAGWRDGRTWAATTIDARCPSGGCWIVLLQPETDPGEHGSHDTTARGNHVINIQGESNTNDLGFTLAHEIGHGLSLLHAPPVQNHQDVNYPRADGGMGPFIGLRYAPSFAVVSGEDQNGNTTAFDIMSYSKPAWFSPYSYCKAMAVASSNRITCPASAPR